MTEEERQRMMEFILAQQAQFWASMQRHEESQAAWQAKHDESRAAWQAKHEEWQKRSEARLDHSDERADRASLRMDRLERILKLAIRADQRSRRELRKKDERLRERFAEITEMIAGGERAGAETDRRLNALIDIVREQRSGAA